MTVALSGCGRSSEPTTGESKATLTAAIEKTVEVGCGSCTYGMEGVKGCKTAAKIDDKTYLVSGGGLDAHTSGLCSKTPKQAKVVGQVKDGKFVASKIELIK